MRTEIIKSFHKRSIYTDKMTKYLVIRIINEPTKVSGISFTNTHIYNVPTWDKNRPDKYLQPFNDVDYNTKHDFIKFRKIEGLLSPSRIKTLRKKYDLTQRELAALLGLSFATISKIENNEIVQSTSQDSALRNLLHPMNIVDLIKDRKPVILSHHYDHVSEKTLQDKAKKIAKVA